MDIWSLGCVILEAATGRKPWVNLDNEWAIMWNIAGGQKPQLPTPDQLSPAGIDFLNRCFEREPTKRGTAAELLQHDWVSSGPDRCFGMSVEGNFMDRIMEDRDERGVVFEKGRPFEKSESEDENDSHGHSKETEEHLLADL
jgi:serine/threonine protein kinase